MNKDADFKSYRYPLFAFTITIVLMSLLACGNGKGPSDAQVSEYLVDSLQEIFELAEIQCKRFPSSGGSSGRVSCAGTLLIKEDLYASDDNEAMSELKKRSQHYQYLLDQLYGTKFSYYKVSHQARTPRSFTAELTYYETVNGWVIQGSPTYREISSVEGKARRYIEREDTRSVIVGSPEYDEILKKISEAAEAMEASVEDFSEQLVTYLLNEKSFIGLLQGVESSEDLFILEVNAPTLTAPTRGSFAQDPRLFLWERGYKGDGEMRWLQRQRWHNSTYEVDEVVPISYEMAIGLNNNRWVGEMTVVIPGKKGWHDGKMRLGWTDAGFQETRGKIHNKKVFLVPR